jgi:REP element-mobilizing transposase RayT/CheY-like chemotaxis protein
MGVNELDTPYMGVPIKRRSCNYAQPMINFIGMITLLVVTSDFPFGDLIRQSLEETGRFIVRIAGEKESAVAFVKEVDNPLVFLDSCLAEKDLLQIGAQVRHANANTRFVVISEAGWHSALEELAPEDYLSKPFYLPDLLEMMNSFYPAPAAPETSPASADTGSNPPWLSDVTRAAQHLTRLTLGSSAQAALITRDDQLWAYAGQLPQSATGELTETVSRYWDRQEENDLVRFIRLDSTNAEHMLYATRLTRDMVLALIFDAETPFSKIRMQANQLVHSLSTSPTEKQNGIDHNEDEGPSAPASGNLTGSSSPTSKGDLRSLPLGSQRDSGPAFSLPSAAPLRFNRSPSPAIPVDQLPSTEQVDYSNDLEKTEEYPVIIRKGRFGKTAPSQADMGETAPTRSNEPSRKIVLEPVSPSVYNLDYACLLVPRFTQHLLLGDLSVCLSDWVHEICIAFGWRLEYMSVRPEHLLWIVNVPPATSPGHLMRILRQHTSEKIFSEFPRFKKENPSGDFWAPGYLIMGGSQPPPAQLIRDFIAQTRQRQGISQPLR